MDQNKLNSCSFSSGNKSINSSGQDCLFFKKDFKKKIKKIARSIKNLFKEPYSLTEEDRAMGNKILKIKNSMLKLNIEDGDFRQLRNYYDIVLGKIRSYELNSPSLRSKKTLDERIQILKDQFFSEGYDIDEIEKRFFQKYPELFD